MVHPQGKTIDGALRALLAQFRLPGEAQQIDRVMEAFAARYVTTNPGVFATADAAYLLAFAIIMLNTDAHHPMAERRLGKADFVAMAFTQSDEGFDAVLPAAEVEAIYDRIVANEIKMKDERAGGPAAAAAAVNGNAGGKLLSRVRLAAAMGFTQLAQPFRHGGCALFLLCCCSGRTARIACVTCLRPAGIVTSQFTAVNGHVSQLLLRLSSRFRYNLKLLRTFNSFEPFVPSLQVSGELGQGSGGGCRAACSEGTSRARPGPGGGPQRRRVAQRNARGACAAHAAGAPLLRADSNELQRCRDRCSYHSCSSFDRVPPRPQRLEIRRITLSG